MYSSRSGKTPGRLAVFLALLVTAGSGPGASGAESLDPFDIYHYHAIDSGLSTAGQISDAQAAQLADDDFSLIINLATADAERNRGEAFPIAESGITYVNIPVDWSSPSLEDLALFFDFMDARGERRTLVHCFANYRASAFVYLYRTLREGVDEATARADLDVLWTPEIRQKYPQWTAFMEHAQQVFAR